MKKRKSLEKPKMGILGYLAVVVVVLLAVFPIYWLVITSIKPKMEWVVSPPLWIPRSPTLLNYIIILFPTKAGVEYVLGSYVVFKPAVKAFIDSTIVAGLGTVLAVIVGLLAAFAVSRHGMGGNSFMGLTCSSEKG